MVTSNLETTSVVNGDPLRENIKSVLHSDMEEESKINVIIGLCTSQPNYLRLDDWWKYPPVTYCNNAKSTGSDLR